jgi:hypothetical protein
MVPGRRGRILAGGLPAGIYQTSTAEQCRYIAEHAKRRWPSRERTLPGAVPSVRAELPALRAIVLMEGESATRA